MGCTSRQLGSQILACDEEVVTDLLLHHYEDKPYLLLFSRALNVDVTSSHDAVACLSAYCDNDITAAEHPPPDARHLQYLADYADQHNLFSWFDDVSCPTGKQQL